MGVATRGSKPAVVVGASPNGLIVAVTLARYTRNYYGGDFRAGAVTMR